MVRDPARFIAIEGPIGVGKTTLARRLAHSFGFETILEDAASNPFLQRFYEKPGENALATQLFFLFQRAQQLQMLGAGRRAPQAELFRPGIVADYMLQKDRMFARINLTEDELDLYNRVYESMTIDVPAPELVIYLQAPPDVLLKRIAKRGTAYERGIAARYLEALNHAYTEFFHGYQDGPLLIVNAAEINLASSEQDYQALVERICDCQSGRHYFNPLPANATPVS